MKTYNIQVALSQFIQSTNMLLVVDGGSTKTISVIFDEASRKIISIGLSGSANYTTNTPDSSKENLMKSIGDALHYSGLEMDSIERAIVSIVGIGDSSEATQMGNQILLSVIGQKKYEVINDGKAAYYMGNCGEDGVIFAPGTGSVGYIKIYEEMKRYGGWGWSIGDMSSATWFSKKAVEIAMLETDSESEATPFKEELENYFHFPLRELAWQIERRYIPKEHLASFSVKLSEMAKYGDENAIKLFEESASYMGTVISGIRRKYPEAKRVSIMGGTMQAGSFYHDMIRRYIQDVHLYYGYEIVVGAIMKTENEMNFNFRDDLLKQLDDSLKKLPKSELTKYLHIDRPLPLP